MYIKENNNDVNRIRQLDINFEKEIGLCKEYYDKVNVILSKIEKYKDIDINSLYFRMFKINIINDIRIHKHAYLENLEKCNNCYIIAKDLEKELTKIKNQYEVLPYFNLNNELPNKIDKIDNDNINLFVDNIKKKMNRDKKNANRICDWLLYWCGEGYDISLKW